MLTENNIDHEVVLYMKQKPTAETLRQLVSILEDDPSELVRRDKFFKDTIAGEQGFDAETLSDPEVVVALLAEHPRLLQRPVIVSDDVAIIGRPRERVPQLFGL